MFPWSGARAPHCSPPACLVLGALYICGVQFVLLVLFSTLLFIILPFSSLWCSLTYAHWELRPTFSLYVVFFLFALVYSFVMCFMCYVFYVVFRVYCPRLCLSSDTFSQCISSFLRRLLSSNFSSDLGSDMFIYARSVFLSLKVVNESITLLWHPLKWLIS